MLGENVQNRNLGDMRCISGNIRENVALHLPVGLHWQFLGRVTL